MISSEEFIRRWEAETWPPGEKDPLIRFPKKLVEGLEIPIKDREFLWKAGLPKKAGFPNDFVPYLQFHEPRSEHWPIQSGDLSSDAYRRLYLIGCGACGDPIAIDGTANGKIVELLHEFDSECNFVNTTVRQLAFCLLAYRKFATDTRKANGDDAFATYNIPTDLRKRVEDELRQIDFAALESGCFWQMELDGMDHMMADRGKPVADFVNGKI